jgi:hypothetical protein
MPKALELNCIIAAGEGISRASTSQSAMSLFSMAKVHYFIDFYIMAKIYYLSYAGPRPPGSAPVRPGDACTQQRDTPSASGLPSSSSPFCITPSHYFCRTPMLPKSLFVVLPPSPTHLLILYHYISATAHTSGHLPLLRT